MAIKASELNKLTRAFINIKTQVLEACSETISDICEDVYKEAKSAVPVQTGNLKRSLVMKSPSYNIGRGETEVYGEVHFGEPGNVGGWKSPKFPEGQEAYKYMWKPGYNEDNWGGKILYDGWEINKDRVVPELIEKIKSKI